MHEPLRESWRDIRRAGNGGLQSTAIELANRVLVFVRYKTQRRQPSKDNVKPAVCASPLFSCHPQSRDAFAEFIGYRLMIHCGNSR